MGNDYVHPCGAELTEPGEAWKDEVACYMIGCRDCKYFNGTEYFKLNLGKAMAMWAKKQLEDMNHAQS